jgi:hypothetical protein
MGLYGLLSKNNLGVGIFDKLLKRTSGGRSEMEKMARIFTLGFINYTFNLELSNNMISFLEKKSKTLEEENSLLFNVIEDINKINFEYSQNANSNIFNLKKSMIETTPFKLDSKEDAENLGKLKSSLNIPKVAKMVSRKSLNIFKNLNNQELKKSIISKFPSFLCNTGGNEVRNQGSNLVYPDDTMKSSRDTSPFNTKEIYKKDPDSNGIKRTEDKMDQLNMLREYIVKSFKESEAVKGNFTTIKNDLNKVLSNTQRILADSSEKHEHRINNIILYTNESCISSIDILRDDVLKTASFGFSITIKYLVLI